MTAIRPGIDGSGTPLGSFNPDSVSWLSRARADTLAGSDGTAITTWAQKAGTADSFTGTGTLKTGANGINSQPVVRFNGTTDKFVTTTGGASLAGDWYVAAVVKWNNVTNIQNVLSWGDSGVNAKRRSMLKFGAGGSQYYAFIGESADVSSSSALSVSTAYFLEIRRNGTTISLWVNGTQVKLSQPTNTLLAYVSSVLRLGVNPGNTEPLSADIAEVFFLGSALSDGRRLGLGAYVQTRYGITVANSLATIPNRVPVWSAVGSLSDSQISDNGTQMALGTDAFGSVGGAYFGPLPASVTINGSLYADAGATSEHHLRGSWASQNVVSIQHTSDGNTFSAVRFLRYDGNEQAALGLGNPAGGGVFGGAAYFESSDYTRNLSGSTNAPVPMRFVQTGYIGGSNASYCRQELSSDGSIHFYDLNTTFASRADWLSIDANGNVIVGNAALATNATNGFLYIPSCAGTPTGTPTSKTGRVPMVYDTTNHKLNAYENGAWHASGAFT